MYTTLTVIGLLLFFVALYLLSDTIAEWLSGGKSFAPKELKGFR